MRKELCVGTLPRRKKPCLYMIEGAVITVLAHFLDEAAMNQFLDFNVKYDAPKEESNDDHRPLRTFDPAQPEI